MTYGKVTICENVYLTNTSQNLPAKTDEILHIESKLKVQLHKKNKVTDYFAISSIKLTFMQQLHTLTTRL
jgi:hypothetical protein